jgi:hypothetical protein
VVSRALELKVLQDILNSPRNWFAGAPQMDYSDQNVIAVTTVWYDRRSKQLLECDIMFNTDWTWGDATVNPSVMDMQNIATHELGHCFNLADIYDSSQNHLTMYGYSYPGDFEKRTLEAGDIAGIQSLFGATT